MYIASIRGMGVMVHHTIQFFFFFIKHLQMFSSRTPVGLSGSETCLTVLVLCAALNGVLTL